MLTKVCSATLVGIEARLIEVEVDTSNGLPAFNIVGLVDVSIRESKERIRGCLRNSEFHYPIARISVNLAPADIYKYGTQFDLGMAIGLLISSDQIKADAGSVMFIGELSMNGELRSVRGALAMVLAAREAGLEKVVLPQINVAEAAIVEGIGIIPCSNFTEVIEYVCSGKVRAREINEKKFVDASSGIDFSEVIGQKFAKRALEIAVTGGHNILMAGPPGVGKTMLALAACSIIPEPSSDQIIKIIQVQSAAGLTPDNFQTIPFRNPYHRISLSAFVGGGRIPKPGEVSLASGGILFLDEFPEFPREILENLREPLEAQKITVNRFFGSYTFPADFILIAAQNPCPCGYYGDSKKPCVCPPGKIVAYKRKVSGPILDRIDLQIKLARENSSLFTLGEESSAEIKERVKRGRQVQLARQGKLNKFLTGKELELFISKEQALFETMERIKESFSLSLRSCHRMLRLARTIADLDGKEWVGQEHLSEALAYRE